MSQAQAIRLGIDVGGTNTDAVLMTGHQVIGAVKRATTKDVGSGVVDAVSALLDDTGIRSSDISQVMVGTTQFINAFLQRKNLQEIAIIRIALPKTDGILPMVAWPEDLTPILGSNIYLVGGGAYYTGQEYAELDESALIEIGRELSEKGISSMAISTSFATIRPDIEERAADIIRRFCPDTAITLSSRLGGIGLIDRENAAIVNASLIQFAHRVVEAMAEAFASLQIHCPFLISQNDGTLITGEDAKRLPIVTCAAGPTNSIRGAAFLTGLEKAIVVDIGGTTTDIGFLSRGFPRETTAANYIGGVRTNFRMPDVLSIALGGGTVIRNTDTGIRNTDTGIRNTDTGIRNTDTGIRNTDAGLTVGPDSVGYQLLEKGLVFGGDTLTTTDIAVRSGAVALGDSAKVAHISDELTARVVELIHERIDDAVDQMRTSSEAVPVILVGGGSILQSRPLKGASEVHRPDYAGVANAVGAAIAQVSGRVDKLYDIAASGRDAALAQAKEDATHAAVAAGADPATIEIIDVIELPMTHMQTGSVQMIVRAVGDLLVSH